MFPWPTVWALGFWSNAKKKMLRDFFCPLSLNFMDLQGFTMDLPLVYPRICRVSPKFSQVLVFLHSWGTASGRQMGPHKWNQVISAPQKRHGEPRSYTLSFPTTWYRCLMYFVGFWWILILSYYSFMCYYVPPFVGLNNHRFHPNLT